MLFVHKLNSYNQSIFNKGDLSHYLVRYLISMMFFYDKSDRNYDFCNLFTKMFFLTISNKYFLDTQNDAHCTRICCFPPGITN